MNTKTAILNFSRHLLGRYRNDAKVYLLLTIFSALILGAACTPTGPRPASDSTPPKVRWSVYDKSTGNISKIDGSGSISVRLGDALLVSFFAEDPEGVRRAQLAGSGNIRCKVEGDGESNSQWLTTGQDATYPQSNSAITSVFLTSTISGDFPPCVGQDMSFISFLISFNGSGENYSKLSTKANLTIDFKP